MKVILPENSEKNTTFNPNRSQRRKMRQDLNRKAKRPLTKDEFEQFLMVQRLRHGDIRDDDIRKMASNGIAHYDNPDKFPNGIEVKLNYDEISQRKHEHFREEYWEWVGENKDKIFHLYREDNPNSLVCLEEDERYREIDGETVRIPRWEFDLFADLLVKNEDGEFVSPWNIPDGTEGFVTAEELSKKLSEVPEAEESSEEPVKEVENQEEENISENS